MTLASTNQYETVYILKSGISESDANTIHQKIDNVISKFQGNLKVRDDWGVQNLSYTIDRENAGRFFVIDYSGIRGVVEEIERHFKILDDVIRYLTVSLSEDYDLSKLKRQIHNAEEEVKRNKEARKKNF